MKPQMGESRRKLGGILLRTNQYHGSGKRQNKGLFVVRTRQLQNPDSVLHHVSDVCHIFIVYGFKFDNITGCGAGNQFRDLIRLLTSIFLV